MNIKHVFVGFVVSSLGLYHGTSQAMENWQIPLRNETNQTFVVLVNTYSVFDFSGSWQRTRGPQNLNPGQTIIGLVPSDREPYSLVLNPGEEGFYFWPEIANMNAESTFTLVSVGFNGVRLLHVPHPGDDAIDLGIQYPHVPRRTPHGPKRQ